MNYGVYTLSDYFSGKPHSKADLIAELAGINAKIREFENNPNSIQGDTKVIALVNRAVNLQYQLDLLMAE